MSGLGHDDWRWDWPAFAAYIFGALVIVAAVAEACTTAGWGE